jgi:hypothetical protein
VLFKHFLRCLPGFSQIQDYLLLREFAVHVLGVN